MAKRDYNQRDYVPASSATTAEPGSPEKLKELARRWAQCEELWHDDDVGRGSVVRWSLPQVRVESLIDATSERSRL